MLKLLLGAVAVLIGVRQWGKRPRDRMQAPLGRLRDWLTVNNASVMSVLMVVIGVAILGKGLAGL